MGLDSAGSTDLAVEQIVGSDPTIVGHIATPSSHGT